MINQLQIMILNYFVVSIWMKQGSCLLKFLMFSQSITIAIMIYIVNIDNIDNYRSVTGNDN